MTVAAAAAAVVVVAVAVAAAAAVIVVAAAAVVEMNSLAIPTGSGVADPNDDSLRTDFGGAAEDCNRVEVD